MGVSLAPPPHGNASYGLVVPHPYGAPPMTMESYVLSTSPMHGYSLMEPWLPSLTIWLSFSFLGHGFARFAASLYLWL